MWDVNVTGDSSLVLAQTLVYAQVGADRVCEAIVFSSVLDAILRVAVKDAKGRKLFTASIALRDTNLTNKRAKNQPKVQIALF